MTVMKNNKIGKLESFALLLKEEESIIIPKVQRDYIYGRSDEKARSVLDDILDNILDAIIYDSNTILDFVYGGAFIRKNNDTAGLIPLDGQQRLTTLFLLFFYATLLKDSEGNRVKKEEAELLHKFRYETRQSATDFCRVLLNDIRDHLLESYDPQQQNLKHLIVDSAKYLKTYDSDPTVISMLNVLDIIEKKCWEKKVPELKPGLWNRLMERNNVQFYKLTLDKFGLCDDLFIKMNARGKKLTSFEIFKSDLIARIKNIDEGLKDRFTKDMDTRWIDIVWDYTDKTLSDRRPQIDVTNDADVKYAMLFHNIFRLEYFRRGLYQNDKEELDYSVLLSDAQGIESIGEIFETLYTIHKEIGYKELWDKYFYFSDDVIGKDDSIRLFWKKKRESVFEIALTDELSVPEIVYFYAMYLLFKNKVEESCCKRCLRVIRNLMTANVRAVDARTNKLSGFLAEVEYIIEHQGYLMEYDPDLWLEIDSQKHKLSFIQTAWNEEYKKQQAPEYEKFLKYENHQILNCSVALFMDHCQDAGGLLYLLNKFEKLFDNNCYSNFDKLRILFLDRDIEYMQYEPYMVRDGRKEKMRYFITRNDDWSDFFIKNNLRRNQDNMLSILEKIDLQSLDGCTTGSHLRFDTRDWRYYIAKYPTESNLEWTRYGLGIWDEPDSYPLDLILLNSSYHSSGNLEWKMLTYLLKRKLNNDDSYRIDDHGCSPIILTSCASTIGFERGRWEINTDRDIIIPQSINNVRLKVCYFGENQITVDFADSTREMDYIDLGLWLVSLIEEAEQEACKEI